MTGMLLQVCFYCVRSNFDSKLGIPNTCTYRYWYIIVYIKRWYLVLRSTSKCTFSNMQLHISTSEQSLQVISIFPNDLKKNLGEKWKIMIHYLYVKCTSYLSNLKSRTTCRSLQSIKVVEVTSDLDMTSWQMTISKK